MRVRLPRSLLRPLVTASKLLMLGAALVLVAAVSAWLTVRSTVSSRDVLVPDLAGLTAAEAEEALGKEGLRIEQVSERYDAGVQEGHILSQEPAPGSSIKVDRKVKVIVSLGKEGLAVPELRGGAARSAQITLRQQGLRVGDLDYSYSAREDENTVIAQDPMPGTPAGKDQRVSLLVSRGRRPATYVMPDLRGRLRSEVMHWLERAGLRAAPPRRDPGSAAPAGTIVAQRPDAGWPVRSGDVVTLTVAGEDASDE
jgi:beta-lactam-binding protein with PASTA domain